MADASRIVGREVDVEFVAPVTPVPGLPPVMIGLAAAFETYESVIDTSDVAREFGIRPTHVGDALRAMLIDSRQDA